MMQKPEGTGSIRVQQVAGIKPDLMPQFGSLGDICINLYTTCLSLFAYIFWLVMLFSQLLYDTVSCGLSTTLYTAVWRLKR